MNLKTFLLFSAALLAWILFSKVYMLLYYWAVLLACASFLHTRPLYLQQPYKQANLLFFLYMLFIVWERTRNYKFSPIAELLINDAEHILFAVIISTLISLILITTGHFSSYAKPIIITICIFNAVGLINEIFQNMLSARPLFVFIADSQKDMLMNVIGTPVFLVIALLAAKRKWLVLLA